MNKLDYKKLGEQIKEVFLGEGTKYQVDKHVPEFKKDGQYVGDFFTLSMFELDGENSPIFYHTYSPYDKISGKTTDYAAIFKDGERLVDIEFVPFMRQRTGVMSSLVLTGLGYKNLNGKKVLYVGTGKIAQHDIEALKAHFPDLSEVSYLNRRNSTNEFTKVAKELDVAVRAASIADIGTFDVIICHTNSKEPVLTADLVDKIKSGAVITSFTSEDFTEVDSAFFDSEKANITIDWAQTIQEAPELKKAVENGKADKEQITTLKELFGGASINVTKQYTIYRSHGTPMQNLAALKLLIKN